jgi:ElaB/YqjD/DUF883 family membrane-anchored ribosome-binding protein
MSSGDIRIAVKRGQAEAARERLVATVDEIKLRLAPKSIAQEAWEGAKDKGAAAAESAVTTVKERPALAAGVAAGAALILARKPIIGLLTNLFSDNDKPAGAKAKRKE